MRLALGKKCLLYLCILTGVLSVLLGACSRKLPEVSDITLPEREISVPELFRDKLLSLRWVTYSPTNWDPDPRNGFSPSEESIEADLLILRQYFDGIVTYGANEIIPQVAKKVGFSGMLFGIWNPTSKDELAKAKAAAQNEIVIGFVVGNEGLDDRYDYETLRKAIQTFRVETGKPVTTTEQVTDYYNPQVLELGDWVFPNVHPYFHKFFDPTEAVEWTERQYKKLVPKTTKPIIFKEVGLPSAGSEGMSEQSQSEYYRQLQQTKVYFVYFEAFDQPWKTHLPIEPHWGLFHSDRTPKLVVKHLPTKR